mgnify:CR=1 FL=1
MDSKINNSKFDIDEYELIVIQYIFCSINELTQKHPFLFSKTLLSSRFKNMTGMRQIIFLFLCSILTQSMYSQHPFTGKYPDTKKIAHEDTYFGTVVQDPYRWLEDDKSAETKEWVKAENKVTSAYLEQIPFRKTIFNRLKELWNYEKYSAPFTRGKYTYFYKNDGLQNQSVMYRQTGSAAPEVFIDPNTFSKDGTVSLSNISFSKDGTYCAYQLSKGGSDWNTIVVMHTSDKKLIGDPLRDVKFSGVSWRANTGFYYSSYDKPKEGSVLSGKTDRHKLFFHKLNTPQSSDQLIFGGDQTPRRYIGGGLTEDERFLVISAANATYGNELYIQDLNDKGSKIVPIVTGFDTEQSLEYNVGNDLYITTNLNAPNRRLVKTRASMPESKNWVTVIPEREFPMTISTGGGKVYAQYIKDAISEIVEYSQTGQKIKEIELPGLGTASGFSGRIIDKTLYYNFSSYTSPSSIYAYDVKTGKSTLYKKPNIPADLSKYESKQVFYPSKDGTKIPMILTYKKGTGLNGKNPTILYGYGGFNISLTPNFSISILATIEAGGIYAVANLRGGGEYGDTWHDAGTKMNKQNVFDDFIAAAEYLISEKYTSPQYLAISGGSNGGLLVGACLTQRPELFRVALPAVGVMDMLRYNKFTAGAGWAYDYGTAEDSKEMFDYLYKYSPVHAATQQKCYPATLVTTGDHDDRVVPAHSFKFAATLQEHQNCTNPVMIRIETDAGHGAGKPTDKIIEELADKMAFTWWNMGLEYKPEK